MSRTLEVLAVGSQHGVVELCASVSAVTCCPESPAYGLPKVAVVFCPLFGSSKSITWFSGEDVLPMKNTFFFFLILKMIDKRLEEQHQMKAHLQVWKWQCLNADSQHRNPVTLLTQAFIDRYLVPIWCCNKSLHIVADAVFHCFWVTENVNFLTFKRWMCTVRLA